MNVKLKILRKVLEEAINNIDAGNSNHSDDELDDIISSLTKLNRGIKRISKREACERILHYTKNLLLFFVLFQVILYLLAAIILKCIII
jgi:hypothetical protein